MEDAALSREECWSRAQAYSIDGHDLHVTASIGVSSFPKTVRMRRRSLRTPTMRCTRQSRMGIRATSFFKPEMNVRA